MSEAYQFGLIGRNIAYSKSPDIFRAIHHHTGIVKDFRLVDIPPERLDETIAGMRTGTPGGYSVTIPYKQAVIPLLDEVEPIASKLNAVNSIKCDGTRLIGYNTDREGFVRPLLNFESSLRDKPSIVLGNGGVARAAVFGLAQDIGVSRIDVYGRDKKKVMEFVSEMSNYSPDFEIYGHSLADLDKGAAKGTGVVVNATPLGGFHHTNRMPLPESFDWQAVALYYDLNYNADNPAVRTAREWGVAALDGTGMLVAQAIRSLEIWTGRSAPFDSVYTEVFGRRA